MATLLNFVAMQISWFACVLGAANQMPWLGVIVSLAVVAVHLLLAERRNMELKVVLAALAIGLILDSTLSSAGLIAFSSGTLVTGATTPWMLGLWIGFATALTTTLSWIIARPFVAVLFGAFGGPAAYWSGAQLGAIVLHNEPIALVCIGLGWASAMWLFTVMIKKLRSTAEAPVFA